MRRLPVVPVALWVATTALATAGAWAGVATVTADVTGSQDVALPAAEEASVPSATTSTTTTTSTTAAPVTTTTTAAPSSVAVVASTTTTAPPTTSTTAPTPEPVEATFANRAGVITVACRDVEIELRSARPTEGHQMEVRRSGPDEVRVAFHGDDGTRAMLGARCEGGTPVQLEPPPPRDGPRRRSVSGAPLAPRT